MPTRKKRNYVKIVNIHPAKIFTKNGGGPATLLWVDNHNEENFQKYFGQNELWKNIHPFFCYNFFIDHKLLDCEGILKRYQTLIFAKNGCGPATPLRITQHCWKILKFFIDHKLLDGKRILLKYPTLIFAKKWVWSCHAPQSGQIFLGTFSIFFG